MATASSELGGELWLREKWTPYWRALVWIENWMEAREAVEGWPVESHALWMLRMQLVMQRYRYPRPLYRYEPEVPEFKEELRPSREFERVAAKVERTAAEQRAQDAIELCRAERKKRPVKVLKRFERAEWRRAFWVPKQAWSFALSTLAVNDSRWSGFTDVSVPDRAERTDDESWGWWREWGESQVHAGE